MHNPYFDKFKGRFIGILRWPQLTEFWGAVGKDRQDTWYIYHVGDTVPDQPVSAEERDKFINGIDQLLRSEHKQDYCGIVYVDNVKQPSFIKIFDPNNLGVSCGFSNNPPLPAWILSLEKPVDLPLAMTPPNNRRRWFQRLFTLGQ